MARTSTHRAFIVKSFLTNELLANATFFHSLFILFYSRSSLNNLTEKVINIKNIKKFT